MPKTAIQAYGDAGREKGYLYITSPDGTVHVEPNTLEGLAKVRLDALQNIPVWQNIRAFGTITINSAPAGTVVISNITIGTESQFQNAVTVTGLTETQTATAIAAEINSFTNAALDYTATSVGTVVTVYAPASLGSGANTHTISISYSSGALSETTINPGGGASAGADTSGNIYHIDANYDTNGTVCAGTASSGSVGVNAIDITLVIVQKTASSGAQRETVTIASGLIDFERKANVTLLFVSGQGAAADILTDISTAGRSDGDLLWLMEGSGGEDITVTDTGNINIAESIDFLIDAAGKAILLRYDLTNNDFTELFRTSVFTITVAGMRTASIPQPISGTTVTALGTGGGTINLATESDTGYQIYTGTGTLLASHTIQKDAADTPLDNDCFWIDYRATFTPDGNNVTIFGLSLTDKQILKGNVLIKATWDLANSVYRARLILDLGVAGTIENAMIPTNEIGADKLELQGAVTAGSYTNTNATVDPQGVITAMTSGSALSAGLGAYTENMALVYTAGDLRITTANGTVFSSSSIGKVVIPSTGGARLKILLDVNTDTHFFVDDAGASDIVGEEFGVTSGTAWGNARPFYLYACNLNDTAAGLKFAISPNPSAIAVPAATNLGYHGSPAATPSDLNFFFLSSSSPATLATKPCALIGRIRMTMSAADDWTVITDASGSEIGIDQDPFFGYWYNMPLAQMGAAAGTFLKGASPVFTTNHYRYTIGRDGYVDCNLSLDADGGTDGSDGADVLVALPYVYRNTDFDAIAGMGATLGVAVQKQVLGKILKNTTSLKLYDIADYTNVINTFYANGARELFLKLRYQSFLT